MELRLDILNALEILEGRRAQLEKKLDTLDENFLVVSEREGKWSVLQVLAHLSNSEFGAMRYIQKKMKGIDSLKERDMSSRIRSVLLNWFLHSGIKFKMPKQLPEPSTNLSYEELKEQFSKNRLALKALIENFPEEALDLLIFKHPFAGRFSLFQTVGFLDDHYTHHMSQIDRILLSAENR